MVSTQNFSKKKPEVERLHINLARLKKGGKRFEIVIDPDKAVVYKEKQAGAKSLDDVSELLTAERIFEDAQKGIFSSKSDTDTVFPGMDILKIAELILSKGELQLSASYREKLQDDKRKKIIETIHTNSVNPQTNLPHPVTRIENAFAEAKIRIDEHKSVHDQVQEIVKKLQPILPIKFEHKHVQVHISEKYAKKYYKTLHMYGRVLNETWASDGCYVGTVEVPAGLYLDFIEDLNKKTHGGVEITLLDQKNGKYGEEVTYKKLHTKLR